MKVRIEHISSSLRLQYLTYRIYSPKTEFLTKMKKQLTICKAGKHWELTAE